MRQQLEPPYYVVIFTTQRTDNSENYAKTDTRMFELAQQQPGFLGVDSARNEDRLGITVSYWQDLESIKNWKANLEHLEAQRLGREKWYQWYRVEIARIERAYQFDKNSL